MADEQRETDEMCVSSMYFEKEITDNESGHSIPLTNLLAEHGLKPIGRLAAYPYTCMVYRGKKLVVTDSVSLQIVPEKPLEKILAQVGVTIVGNNPSVVGGLDEAVNQFYTSLGYELRDALA